MQINTKEFSEVLTDVKPGLSDKNIIEQSSHFVFDDDLVRTYNDDITITAFYETGLKGAVIASNFYKLMSKINDEEISIEMADDDNSFVISGKKIKSSIAIDFEIKLPEIDVPDPESDEWKTLPDNFIDGLSFAIFSASQNMLTQFLTCLWVTEEYIVSSDNFRATKFSLSEETDFDFLIPASAAKDLIKYNPTSVITEEAWLHFKDENDTIFSCRTYANLEYPEKIFDLFDVDGIEVILPEGFNEAIARAESLTTCEFVQDKIIELIIQKGQMICRGYGQYGWIEEREKIDYKGKKIEMKVQPDFLMQILKYLQTMTVGEHLKFTGESFEHVICLTKD